MLGKMHLEQIIEFNSREFGPSSRTCNSITGYFYDKTKIPTINLRVKYDLLLKFCCKSMYLALPPRPRHLQNLTQKC